MKFFNYIKQMSKKNIIMIVSVVIIVIISLSIVLATYFIGNSIYKPITSPIGLSSYVKTSKITVNDADFYVSTKNGKDNNDGKSTLSPIKSIEKAQEKVSALINSGYNENIVVAVMGGEYNLTNGLSFGAEDCFDKKVTYISYDAEEVILNGGLTLPYSSFKDLSELEKTRFYKDVQNEIKAIDLFELGLTSEQIGKMYSAGGFAQGEKYGEEVGHPSAVELFYNDQRMTVARYPNEGYSKIKNVVDYGEAAEHVEDIIDWDNTATPRPPKYIVSNDVKKRMKNWQVPTSELNSLWAFGYFYWDWADSSSPISNFDATSGQIDLKYSSPYGIQKNAIYYVYNIMEELDCEGEYYIDREKGKMYFMPPKNFNQNSDIQLSVTSQSVINIKDTNDKEVKNIVFDGFTIKGTRADAINIEGNNCEIINCILKNSAENGIRVDGFNNTVKNCEITLVGKNGIYVGRKLGYKEGDLSNDIRVDGLKIENNLIYNNLIHKYGEIQKTYTSGVSITGVGNIVRNNEIFDAPHMGIFYEGNEHLIEYNYLHNVVKNSSDAGAIYAGRNFSYYGNVIRYNCISDIGSGEFTPAGIYFDDCLAGQTAYGNILINIPSCGFLIGGGRENNIYNNLIINAKVPISYDARAYDGRFSNGWYHKNTADENSRQWILMKDAQELYNIWQSNSKDIIGNRYDAIMDMVGYEDLYASNNAMNPNSTLKNNVCISKNGKIGDVAEAAKKYGLIENNFCYKLSDKNLGFSNWKAGDYRMIDGRILAENPIFEVIPINKIGRTN